MKKHLLCTSAIALGVAAAPAAAQEWNLDWGGYYNTHVGFADVSGAGVIAPTQDFDGMGIVGDGEIIFTPSVTLDNGLTFGLNVQMEAQNGGGGVDGRLQVDGWRTGCWFVRNHVGIGFGLRSDRTCLPSGCRFALD